jgi:hypothetical protein
MWIGTGETLSLCARIDRMPTVPELDEISPSERMTRSSASSLEDVARRGLGRFAAPGDDGRLTALCHVRRESSSRRARDAPPSEARVARQARMIIG